MKMRMVFAVMVSLASASAVAADTLSIDSVVGVYKVNAALPTKPAAEDILEVVKVSPTRAYIRMHAEPQAGNACNIWGVAEVSGSATLVYRGKNGCALTVDFVSGSVSISDPTGACQKQACTRAPAFSSVSIPAKNRRAITYMPRLLASREYTQAMAEAGTSGQTPPPVKPASAPVPLVANPTVVPTVTPMHVKASVVHMPRLSGLPTAVQNKINAALAAREKQAREDRQGCVDLVTDAGQSARNVVFQMTIDATYVSARYVSFDIHNDYDCAGAYPTNDAPDPMTFDLTTGEAVDWAKVFKAGALPSDNGDPDAVPGLIAAYQKRYPREGGRADPECNGAVQENLSAIVMWLDAKRGLVIQPDFPHVMAACADKIAFTPAQLAPYVRDAKFLADLQATVRPAR